jgi:hypothetical protein
MTPLKPPRTAGPTGIRNAVTAAPAAPVAELAPRPAPEPARPRQAPRAARQRPVRFTLDLAPELHTYLGDVAAAAGADKSDVMRELLRQMRADPDLAARVSAEVQRRRDALREAQRLAQE